MFTDFVAECRAHKAEFGYNTSTNAASVEVPIDIPVARPAVAATA